MPEETSERREEPSTPLKTYAGLERKLVGVEKASKWANSSKLKERTIYRNLAAQLAQGYDSVVVTDTTPQPAIDRLYDAALKVEKKRAGGYFGEHKKSIVDEAESKVLAQLNPMIYHEKGDEARNKKIGIIEKIRGIQKVKEDLKKGKVKERELVGVLAGYIENSVDSRLSSEDTSNAGNKYLTPKEREIVKNALIGIVASDNNAAVYTLGLMEKENNEAYKKEFPDDDSAASFVRESLQKDPDEERARKGLSIIMGLMTPKEYLKKYVWKEKDEEDGEEE